MTNQLTDPTNYRSLEEIAMRRRLLKEEIDQDRRKITQQWQSLFHKPEGFKKDATPSKRISSIINTGAGLVDAFLLGWKLYRKFKK
jgi:hypothetical protein